MTSLLETVKKKKEWISNATNDTTKRQQYECYAIWMASKHDDEHSFYEN